MRDVHILQELLAQHCPEMHKKRLNSLMAATSALLEGDTLSLTGLGRHIAGKTDTKHSITSLRYRGVSVKAGEIQVRQHCLVTQAVFH